ncbi:MAG: integrase catalytic domain-containing protein, partial [Planctomycetota bacterium]
LDRFTRWLQGYAANSKASDEIVRDMQRFLGPQVKPQHVYTDNSKEFIKAMQELNWPHDTSTPHRPQTNGVIERCVRVVKEGTSCAMVQSGLDEKWWPEAMMCFCFLRNVCLVLETGETAYKERFGSNFSGPLIPFGAQVQYLPITHADKTQQHAFGNKMRRGIFLGYVQQAGGGWNGDLYVADWDQIASAEHLSDIHFKRFKSTEVTPYREGGSFIFPIAAGALRQPGSSPDQSDNPDPFNRAGGNPRQDSNDDEGDDDWKELEPFDLEEEAVQKTDPDAKHQHKPKDEDPSLQDFWSFNGEVLTRHHVVPRSSLFVPSDPESPIPTKFLDVLRTTFTDLGNEEENQINDYWNVQGNRVLSDNWVGKTNIPILRKPPPKGWTVIYGRPTKIQETQRPGNLWPEIWRDLSESKKKKAIEDWKIEEPLQREARDLRGLYVIAKEDYEEYDAILKDLKEKLKLEKPPLMPVLAAERGETPGGRKSKRQRAKKIDSDIFKARSFQVSSPTTQSHVERTAPRGHASEEWFACVHTPVNIQKARKIPAAREALEKEWRKLETKKAWDVTKVQPKAKVIRDAKARGVHAHFGSLMDLCHIKNSQMGEEFWSYKGRIVFRGDQTKDEDGYLAVFTEQGASASNMAAAKFMDALARMPGNDGEDSDAIGAYTQVRLSEAAKLLGPGVITET